MNLTTSVYFPEPEYCSGYAVKGILQERRKIDLLRSVGETALVEKHEGIRVRQLFNLLANFPFSAIQKGPAGGV